MGWDGMMGVYYGDDDRRDAHLGMHARVFGRAGEQGIATLSRVNVTASDATVSLSVSIDSFLTRPEELIR